MMGGRTEGRRKRKGESREGWEEGKRIKEGRMDFWLAGCASFPGIALCYDISEGIRVCIHGAPYGRLLP